METTKWWHWRHFCSPGISSSSSSSSSSSWLSILDLFSFSFTSPSTISFDYKQNKSRHSYWKFLIQQTATFKNLVFQGQPKHSYLSDWLGNLAMKTMVLQFMLERPRPCTILCLNVHTTVEYLNTNVSIGQLLQHIPNSIVVCAC